MIVLSLLWTAIFNKNAMQYSRAHIQYNYCISPTTILLAQQLLY